MAPYNFDDRNIKWNTLTLPPVGELKHLLFSITAVRSISEQIQLVSYLRSNAFGGVVGKRLI
jgi:hypothetical protein